VADVIAVAPTDPRFKVRWTCARSLDVTVDAVDRGSYLNSQTLTLELLDPVAATPPASVAIPQVAPGRYALSASAPRTPTIAAVRDALGRSIGRFAIAGRYAAEFDQIGNDRRNLTNLAKRTGGAVIEPDDTRPLRLSRRRQMISLGAFTAAGGACLIALALIGWRRDR
jgi:hypothetical protein